MVFHDPVSLKKWFKERERDGEKAGRREGDRVSVFVFIEDVHSALNRKHEKHKTLSFQAASALV